MTDFEPGTEIKPLDVDDKLNIEDGEEAKEDKKKRTFFNSLWLGMAGGSFVMQIIAIAWEQSTVMIISGIIGLIVAPAVAKYQLDLENTDTLRAVQNMLRKQVNKFQVENNELGRNVDDLQVKVDKLEDQEKKLDSIAKQQGTDVKNLVGLVKENQTILDEMNECLKADAAERMLMVILQSDRDESMAIDSGRELNMLILKLQNLEGIDLDESKLRSELQKSGGTFQSVLNVLKTLDDDDIPPEEKAVSVSTRHLQV